MNEEIKKYISSLKLMHPATSEELARFEAEVGIGLPIEYKEFMLFSNGAYGMIGNSYLQIYSMEDLKAINEMSISDKTLCINGESKPVVCFGSDGGGVAYAFDRRNKESEIISFPLISIVSEEYQKCGSTFYEFLSNLYNAKFKRIGISF